jgi:ribosomal protein S18 acetylase RimI-like enzyme
MKIITINTANFCEQYYADAALLWQAAGVGNPARGDTYAAVLKTLEHGGRLLLIYLQPVNQDADPAKKIMPSRVTAIQKQVEQDTDPAKTNMPSRVTAIQLPVEQDADPAETLIMQVEKNANIPDQQDRHPALQPVGTVWLTHDFRRLYIHHMAVHPLHQNQGYGHLLMQAAVNYACELKLQAKLEVHPENLPANHLYSQYGFEALDGYRIMIRRNIDK